MTGIMDALGMDRVMAVIAVDQPGKAVAIARAMAEGGIRWIEVMFRSPNAHACLQAIIEEDIPGAIVGAGTIRTIDQAERARDVGARFLVAPGLNEEIVVWAKPRMMLVPGVDSTLGIEIAARHELRVLKFFPAVESGGIPWLKAVAGPYPDVAFVPTGGINMSNLTEYLRQPNVLAVAGSFLAPRDAIESGDHATITRTCRTAVSLAREIGSWRVQRND